ncbi:MAG: hypothetical protein JRC92_11280, partial [Deltaproteobacteria bacterium]|nr:hypothetical protein [Deltaproteobacteria bacterium]
INLALKLAKNRELTRVLHWENASTEEIYQLLTDFCEIPLGDMVIPEAEAVGVRVALLNHFISDQLPYLGLAKKYITIRDIHQILGRTVWKHNRSGRIGGKAAGMILAHRILRPLFFEARKEFVDNIRVPESYYVRSDILDEFNQENHLEHYHHRKYESREKIEEDYPKIKLQYERASYSPETLARFKEILEEIGPEPIILRSSSFLEDNFGLAFSGKYESVFLANQGDIQTRLAGFIQGVKRVHMSTYHPDPIMYRQDYHLLDYNEHMSVLVQKVVGRCFNDYFFPFASGVTFSVNSYVWNPKIDRNAGLVRMVLGLGTRAVDRVGSDYPRMVPLSHPGLRPEATAAAIRKYSQKKVDVLNLKTGQLESLNLTDFLREVRHPEIHQAVSIAEGDHLAPPLSRLTPFEPEQACVTFDRLFNETQFITLIREMVQEVARAYGRPVDMEFAYDDGMIYLLQCRSLSLPSEENHVELPTNIPPDRIIFTVNTGLPNRVLSDLEYVIYVDPLAYDRLASQEEKLQVARAVSFCNRALGEKRFVLFGPGRWGSNDINLGVQVKYHDINRTKVLGEVAFPTDGVTPEVSFGTHFFNDLIEADIVPLPIYPGEEGTVFNLEFFQASPSIMLNLAPEYDTLTEAVRVIHVPAVTDGLYLQVYLNGAESEGVGFLGARLSPPGPS